MAQRKRDQIPDQLLLLEHPAVVTLGRASSEQFLKVSEDQLESLGIELVVSGRGGEITFHGPGQLVAYPILKLQEPERDLHRYMRRLEEVGIKICAYFGLPRPPAKRVGPESGWATPKSRLSGSELPPGLPVTESPSILTVNSPGSN